MTLSSYAVQQLPADLRMQVALGMVRPSEDSPDPEPCICGHSDLRVWHQFGGMVVCAGCGTHGSFVPGTNYQREEADAIWAWNRMPRFK